MHYTYEKHPDDTVSEAYIDALKTSNFHAYQSYINAVKSGVAKEQARFGLPQNIMTFFSWDIDLRNLTNFLVLRGAHDAQAETQFIASSVEGFVKERLPVFYDIWCEAGKPRLSAQDA